MTQNDGLTPKQRYFKKKYDEAPMIDCACGCGEQIKSVDKYARPKKFVSGHNRRIYEVVEDTAKAAKKRWKKRNPEWVKEDKKARYRRLKVEAIHLLGGKCRHCELAYNGKNAPAFDFHHRDPSVKERTLTQMFINLAWKTVLVELDKCDLLCAICHRIHHTGEW
jgi:hypothetical protein